MLQGALDKTAHHVMGMMMLLNSRGWVLAVDVKALSAAVLQCKNINKLFGVIFTLG